MSRDIVPQCLRISLSATRKRVPIDVRRAFSRPYYQGQYTTPQTYFPQRFPQPTYSHNDIPWSQQSRWVRWPAYLCAVGIVGWWGWGLWHVEKAPFSNRRRIMLYTQVDMSRMQIQNEEAAGAMLGISDVRTLFRSMDRIMNEEENKMLVPVVRKLYSVKEIEEASEQAYKGLPQPTWSIHLVNDSNFFDHSVWPARTFISSATQALCDDHTGLATIISHSLAHSFLNHRGEHFSLEHFIRRGLQPAPILVLLAIASRQMRLPATIYCLSIGALLLWYERRWGRIVEDEADRYGLQMMNAAGYDVTKATKYWERKIAHDLQQVDAFKAALINDEAREKFGAKEIQSAIDLQRTKIKVYKTHIATINKYIQDNGILPQQNNEQPPPTDSEQKSDSGESETR